MYASDIENVHAINDETSELYRHNAKPYNLNSDYIRDCSDGKTVVICDETMELYRHIAKPYNLNIDDFKMDEIKASDKKFQHVLQYPLKEGEGPLLPEVFKLNDPYPGEPPFMRLRKKPAALRFHKYKIDKDPETYWYSKLCCISHIEMKKI